MFTFADGTILDYLKIIIITIYKYNLFEHRSHVKTKYFLSGCHIDNLMLQHNQKETFILPHTARPRSL